MLVELRPSPTERWKLPALVAAAVLVVAIALAVVLSLTSGPKYVSQLTVVNSTPYDLEVAATNGGGHGWTAVGTAEADRTDAFQDVVDQGDAWIFRFSYAGRTAGELRFTHQELAGNHWRVSVPATFGDVLRSAGVNPPPS